MKSMYPMNRNVVTVDLTHEIFTEISSCLVHDVAICSKNKETMIYPNLGIGPMFND